MSKQHTPGPWRHVRRSRVKADKRVICVCVCSGILDDERKANARLIAAAPELLAEAKRSRAAFASLLRQSAADDVILTANAMVVVLDRAIAAAEGDE